MFGVYAVYVPRTTSNAMKKVVKSRLVAVCNTMVLVLKKAGPPLRYTLPGGVKKKKESKEEALIREVGEEIGLPLAAGQAQLYLSQTKKGSGRLRCKHYFVVYLHSQAVAVKEKHKFDAACWVPWKQAIACMDKADRRAVKHCFKNKATRQQATAPPPLPRTMP